MKPTVVLDAAPFCYGPISTLMAVVDHLRRQELELVLLASGTAAEFAGAGWEGIRVVPCNTEDLEDLRRVEPLLRECSVFVSNTNPPSAQFAASLGCRVVYIDTLFWMWDHIDPAIAHAALYLVQDFPGVQENRQRIGKDIRNFEVVGPLIADGPTLPQAARENTCVISFGGMESSLTVPGQTNRYPWVITRLLVEAFERVAPFDRYLFCGRDWVMSSLAEQWGGPRREFRFVPHRELLGALSRCRLLLLSPGLTGAYEAMSLRTPTCLLLPQNYSQQLQADTFLKQPGWPFRGWEWSAVYPEVSFPRYMPEAQAIAQLNEVIRRFESDTRAQQHYLELLVTSIQQTLKSPEAGGALSSGARAAAEKISALARQ
jgi:hypothetical protein